MDRGGDRTLLLSADEDDFEPELSDRDHQRQEYHQYRNERPTSQAEIIDRYALDYYDYGDWTSADLQTDQMEHYAMEGRGEHNKYYDDDDYIKHEVDSPPPYSEVIPPNREHTYLHNASAVYPNNNPYAHDYTCVPPTYTPTTPPTVQTYPRNDNLEQNQTQPPPYVQSYWDNQSIINSLYWRDDPTPQGVAQSLYDGPYAPWPGMPEEPYQDVPSYKICSILILFCCLPMGVAALVYSSHAEQLKAERKYTQAKIVAKKSKTMNITGLVFGIFIWVVNGVFIYFKIKYMQDSY